MAATQSYPVRVDASLDAPLSRSRPVSLQVKVAATLPALPWIATGLLIGGIIFLIGGILLIAIPLRRTSIR